MDDFIPLATLLRGAQAVPVAAAAAVTATSPDAALPSSVDPLPAAPNAVRNVMDFAHADVVHELALMRLAALESFERAKYRLLEALAAEVLGRDLALAPADVEALAQRAVARFADLEPVTIAVSPSDAERVRAPLPLRIDAALQAGDLVVDVRDGALESTFVFRLQSALDRVAAGGAA